MQDIRYRRLVVSCVRTGELVPFSLRYAWVIRRLPRPLLVPVTQSYALPRSSCGDLPPLARCHFPVDLRISHCNGVSHLPMTKLRENGCFDGETRFGDVRCLVSCGVNRSWMPRFSLV
jgi:hypothetical protein